MPTNDIEFAIAEVEALEKADRRQELIIESKKIVKTIKCILYMHALTSEFQFAHQEFEKQIKLLNKMFKAYI